MKFLLFAQLALVLSLAMADYARDTNVYDLSPSNFDKVVYGSNYTTIVKFYAPWCGYCKQLEPIYHNFGKFLHRDGKYAVNVAAVNCDKPANAQLCREHRVQSYPTVMVYRPPKYHPGTSKNAKHVPEVYRGERTLRPMVDFVTSRIKNYVKKIHNLKSDSLPEWLTHDERQKVLLLSNSNEITPLYKTMAIDFLGSVPLAMVSVKKIEEQIVVKVDGEEIELPVKAGESLPILLVYKPETKTFVRYTGGKMKLKDKLEKWIISETGATTGEGALSKKDKKYYSKYRGEQKRARDELRRTRDEL